MSYNHKFPLRLNEYNSYFQGNNNLKDSITEDLKILLLTRKGDYLMDNNYGVGIHDYLFEYINDKEKQVIIKDINFQIKKYISRILVENVEVLTKNDIDLQKSRQLYSRYYRPEDIILDENQILVTIYYSIEGSSSNMEKNKFSVIVEL